MSSPEFKQLMSKSTVAGPAPEEMIHAAEVQLSLRFPPEYRRFLEEYGAIMGNGFEIAGIFAEDDSGPPLWRDVVRATKRFRKSVNGTLPDTLVPIADDGGDVTFYIDTRNHDEDSCGVIAYGPGVDGDTAATSFGEFVLKLARNELTVWRRRQTM